MSRAISIMRDSSSIMIARGIEVVLSTIVLAYLLRSAAPEEIVILPVVGLLTNISATVATLGVGMSCLKLVPGELASENYPAAAGIIRSALIVAIGGVVLFSSVLWLASAPLGRLILGDSNSLSLMKHIVLLVALGTISEFIRSLMRPTGQILYASAAKVSEVVIQWGLIIPCYIWLGPVGLIVGLAVGRLVSIAMSLWILRKFLVSRGGGYAFRRVMSLAWLYYKSSLSRLILSEGDRIALVTLLTPLDLTTYYVATRFGSYLQAAIKTVFFPIPPHLIALQNQGNEAVRIAVKRMSRYVFFAFVPTCVMLAVLSRPLLDLYAGSSYVDSFPILIVFSFYILAGAVFQFLRMGVFTVEEPHALFKLDFIGALVTLGVSFVATYFGGAIGAAVGKLVGFTVSAWLAARILNNRLDLQLDYQAFWQVSLASGGMALVVGGLQLIAYDLYLVPIYMLLGVIVFGLLIAPAVKEEDRRYLRSILPSTVRPLLRLWLG